MNRTLAIAALILSWGLAMSAQTITILGPKRSDVPVASGAWAPPSVDDVQPKVEPGAVCPLNVVLDGATKRAEQLVADVARFDAVEELVQEYLDDSGKSRGREIRRYNYVVEITPFEGVPNVNEYREARSADSTDPDGIVTKGLPALALIFHPVMRDTYEWKCEGKGEWQGQPTWLVHFRQREDRPNYYLAYHTLKGVHRADLKGRAWLSTETFQLVHVEAELARPVKGIGLETHHEFVDYGPVSFPAKNIELWLPKKADLYLHFRGRRYHRTNTFDHFRLFSTDTSETVKAPKGDPQDKQQQQP